MDEKEMKAGSLGFFDRMRNGSHKSFDISFLLQLPNKLQNRLKLKKYIGDDSEENSVRKERGPSAAIEVGQERQLQAWRENPAWVDPPPNVQVSVPKGSFCSLDVKFNVGLPPDAVFDIVIDPDNRRVFKNIKEVISRRVLLDEGHRQVVEVEQAALWKFLWWSGTFSVHVLVDQNREDHTMKFKQLRSGFMDKFEGCWKVEPVFVDENICYPFKPKTWADYVSCTGGKGRVGSTVRLEQLVQPALVPPPPISWYLRGITSKTTEMIVNDLLAEAARIRGDIHNLKSQEYQAPGSVHNRQQKSFCDMKEKWQMHRRTAMKHIRKCVAVK